MLVSWADDRPVIGVAGAGMVVGADTVEVATAEPTAGFTAAVVPARRRRIRSKTSDAEGVGDASRSIIA